jgi:hypothetical protein
LAFDTGDVVCPTPLAVTASMAASMSTTTAESLFSLGFNFLTSRSRDCPTSGQSS